VKEEEEERRKKRIDTIDTIDPVDANHTHIHVYIVDTSHMQSKVISHCILD